jgi:hypothetical protein
LRLSVACIAPSKCVPTCSAVSMRCATIICVWQILRVVHLVAGITDPAGRVHIHDMGEVDDLHRTYS